MKVNLKKTICLLVLFIYTGSSVLQQYFTKNVVDSASVGDYNSMTKYIIILAFFFLLYICFAGVRPLVENKYKNSVLQNLRTHFIKSMENKSIQEFTPAKRAAYLSALNNDVNLICQDYYMTTLDMIGCAMTIVLSIAALFTIDIWMAVIIVGGCLLMAVNPNLFTKQTTERKLAYSLSLKNLNQCVSDFMEGIHIVRTYQYEDAVKAKMEEKSGQISIADFRVAKIRMYINLISTTLQIGQQFLILFVGVLLMASGNLTAGGLLASIQFQNIIALPISIFADLWNTRIAGKAIKTNFETEFFVNKESGNLQPASKIGNVKQISIKNLSYTVNQVSILKHIHLELETDKKYLLIGKSGSGKTSLLRLLYRFDEAYDGEILWDQTEARKLDKKDFYQHITMVFQEAFLFQMDLIDNITLEQDYSKDQVEKVVEQVDLSRLLLRMKDKVLDTDDINALSGGEKQRVALARALLRTGDFALLDEVTASVDHETLVLLEKVLLSSDRGMLFVTHNPEPENLKRYDQIIIMENGSIADQGTYEELRERHAGLF